MTFLVLNRRRILPSLPVWFPAAADELVVLTARGPAEDAGPLDGRLRYLEVVEDYDSPAFDRRIDELACRFDVESILYTAEIDVLRAAAASERLGLPGQGVASATAYRDKFVMKTYAAAGGVPVAPMRRARTAEDVLDFAERHGLPLVLKPMAGAAAAGMRVFDRPAELAAELAGWPDGRAPEDLLAEAWVEGTVYHVDGIACAGRVLLSWPSRYLWTQWESASRSMNELAGMVPEIHPLFHRLQAATARVIAALPPFPRPLPFHAELFHTPADEIALCEVACRAGGGEIVEMVERAFGVNLYEAGLKGLAGRFDEIGWRDSPQRHGWGWLVRRDGVLLDIPARCPLPMVRTYTVSGKIGTRYPPPRSMADILARLVFSLETADVVGELRVLDAWLDRHVRWSVEAAP